MHKPTLADFVGTAAALILGCASSLSRADACVNLIAIQVANSCVVSKDVLWRGAKPDAAAATELINRGVRTVVNLELAHDDRNAFRPSRPQSPR